MSVFDVFVDPFSLPFMARALAVVLMLGVAAGVIGVFINLRSLEFVSDGLVHAVFPGLVVGFVVGAQPGLYLGALVAALLATVVLTLVTRRASPDAAIAVVLTGMFGLGVVIVSRQTDFPGAFESLLFGSLLTVTDDTILRTGLVALAALILVAVTARAQIFRAFDPTGAAAAGYRLIAIDLVLNVSIALVVVAAATAIGNLLVLAILIVPAATARLVANKVVSLLVAGVVCAVLCGWLGLLVAFHASVTQDIALPASAAVVLTMVVVYLFVLAARFAVDTIVRYRRSRKVVPARHSPGGSAVPLNAQSGMPR